MTEDHKVPGSIPGIGILFIPHPLPQLPISETISRPVLRYRISTLNAPYVLVHNPIDEHLSAEVRTLMLNKQTATMGLRNSELVTLYN